MIDADELAREVVRKGTTGLAAIVERLGPDVLDARGELDRKRVARLVFHDDEARRALNAITHPLVAALLSERSSELDRLGTPLAGYEVPLLFEAHIEGALKPVVVVAAPTEIRVARAADRDGASRDEIRARVRAQMPLEEKIRRADYVIENGGALAATVTRADEVLDAICRGFGIDPLGYPVPHE